jgi:hypothetical protein
MDQCFLNQIWNFSKIDYIRKFEANLILYLICDYNISLL